MNLKQLYTKYFLNASSLQRIIVLNGLVFVFFLLLNTLTFLFKTDVLQVKNWFTFSHDVFDFVYKPWSIITYAFLHADFWHILFNMLWLHFFGQTFLNVHTGRRFLNVYFLGAIFGALVFMLAYNFFPAFAEISKSSLVGASAAVSAVMVAATIQSPEMPLRFMFIPITFKLWWICVGLLVLDVVRIPGGNAGGHIAHLGGAFIGYLYMKQLQKGNDIGAPVEKTMDWIVGLFKPTKNVKLKTVHRKYSKTQKTTRRNSITHQKTDTQKQIDAILDKISKSGYESLSKKEKDFLFREGKQ